MKSKINWINVVTFIMMILAIVAVSCLIFWLSKEEEYTNNTEARCKSLGGQMGYSKCYKDGREV